MTVDEAGAGSRFAVAILALLALSVACAPAPRELDPASPAPSVTPDATDVPAGSVSVAYPDEPAAWYPAFFDDPAAGDLAVLWGLPLFHLDEHGQLRPALARSWTEADDAEGWHVDIELATGRWSDGRPVVADDVVETIAALRAGELAEEFAAILAAEAVAENRVRLRFERPYGRWPYLFSGGRSILPAHVIQEGGVEAYRAAVPVSGGAFTLDEVTPGRELVFTANPDSPLGAPELAELRVLFTPSYETALGLLAERQVDVAVGYLALNPVARASELADVASAAPLGGTWVGLWWRSDGRLGGDDTASRDRRARFRDAVGLGDLVEGLLGDVGEEARGVLPGSDGPWTGEGSPVALGGDPQPSLLVPRHQEALSFTARTLQREFRARGGGAELVRLEPPEIATRWESAGDGALLVRRDPPRPALAGRGARDAAEELLRGDRAARVTDPDVGAAQDALHADATVLPLYRIGVAHAWHTGVGGVRPSSWPGLAFWSAPSWTVAPTSGAAGG